MLYTSTEINAILAKANYTLYALGEKAESERFLRNDAFLSTQLQIIYAWKEVVEWGYANVFGAGGSNETEFHGQAAYLLHKVNGMGLDSNIPWTPIVAPVVAILTTTNPVSLVRDQYQSATFSVVASGTGTLVYQWRKDGVNISGANSSSYTMSSVVEADEADYDVVVTDSNGSVTSATASLTVNQVALSITLHPISQTFNAGNSITLVVAATGGTLPYTYQWKKGGVDIGGATSISYNIPSAVSGDAGSYTCTVTDAAVSSVTSNPAVLTLSTGIVIYWGYFDADPYTGLLTSDTLIYQFNETITHDADISVDYPQVAEVDKFFVIKVPSTESVKNNWFNTSFNFGVFPDSVFRDDFVVGSYRYYVSRVTPSIDYTQPIVLSP